LDSDLCFVLQGHYEKSALFLGCFVFSLQIKSSWEMAFTADYWPVLEGFTLKIPIKFF